MEQWNGDGGIVKQRWLNSVTMMAEPWKRDVGTVEQ